MNHLVMSVKMFVNSPQFVVIKLISADWPVGSLDWCMFVRRSGQGQIVVWLLGVPWDERSLLRLLGPYGVLQKTIYVSIVPY